MFLHDNALSHTAKLVRGRLEKLSWEVLPHVAYQTWLLSINSYLHLWISHSLNSAVVRRKIF